MFYRVRREGTLTLGEWLEQESQQKKLQTGFEVGGSTSEFGIMGTYPKKKSF